MRVDQEVQSPFLGTKIEYGGQFQSSYYIFCFHSICPLPDVPTWQITSTRSPSTSWLQNFCLSDSNQLKSATYNHGKNIGRPAILKKSTAKLDSSLLKLLILCGDISNPGPICTHPCRMCSKTIRSNQRAVQCDSCDFFYHVKCLQMSTHIYEPLVNSSSKLL